MSANHSHGIPSTQNERSLWLAFGLTASFFIIEVTSGLLLNSLALIADAAHMFTDVAALAIALAAVRIARRPTDSRRTYGYYRFEILAAAFNAMLLFGVAFFILYEAYQRFGHPEKVHSTAMIIVAAIGLTINLISMRLLTQGKECSLNIKGAYLEVWSDMLGSIGVIVAALIMRYTGWNWVDTIAAIGISLWVLPRAWVLLKESLNILLEGAPEGMDVNEVSQAILGVSGVIEIHDLHVWVLTSSKNSLTAHIVHHADINSELLIKNIQEILAHRFNIYHTTFQTELTPCKHSADGCNFTGS